MPKRHPNYCLAKIHRSYSVEEIANLFGAHKNTVRMWIKNGLPPCGDIRPIIVQGRDLREFLKSRRNRNKSPCRIGEFYCLKCRAPKRAAGGMADCIQVSEFVGNLQALCPDCVCVMNRRVSMPKLDQFRAKLTITFPQGCRRISETP
jgi:hypothetical protein